jgi:hypothetical protein
VIIEMTKKATPPSEPKKPSLLIARTQAEAQIKKQIDKLTGLLAGNTNLKQAETTLDQLAKYNEELLGRIFDNDVIAREYRHAMMAGQSIRHARPSVPLWTDRRSMSSRTDASESEAGRFQREVQEHITALESILQRLELIPESVEESISEKPQTADTNTLSLLLPIFKKFHQLARQIRKRHDNRPTLEVKDEYDVQDLLHVLLKLYFDDIRPEEWTPSYAGSSSKMDFLLKKEQTVIETKKTRKGLTDREVGEQLIVDIQKYHTHPDCKSLICFVYDPEGKIANPKALENDLSKLENGFKVMVIVEPK